MQAMLLKTAIRTVWHEKEKLSGAIVGVALGVFLVVFNWGLYFAYKRDTTVVLDAFDADIWIVPKNQSMFDSFTSIDDLPYLRAKEIPGVKDVARIVWGDSDWRMPDSGGKDYIQILGIDLASSVAARFRVGDADVSRLVRPDGHVLVGKKDADKLGIAARPGGPFEISGRQAFVSGYVDDIRLFTTAGFVLTDVDNARAFLRLPSSHVNYIVCKCLPGADVAEVIRQLQAVVPEHDVRTTRQFHDVCANYWETTASIGPLILMSSTLAIAVGFLIVIMTFYISTLEKVPMYGCLKALGATVAEIAAILGIQVLIVYLLGAGIAAAAISATIIALRDSMVLLLITPKLVAAGLATMFACAILGALVSIRRLFVIDPGEAFRT
jgi:putative ABC transport system permease protein